MIERRSFDDLPSANRGWLHAWHHLRVPAGPRYGCLRVWNDEEIAPNCGFGLTARTDVEIVTYVRKGAITHRDSLGNDGRVEAGAVQVLSAGSGVRHAEYNLERTPAQVFQIWMAPMKSGGSPAWASQPCATAVPGNRFVPIASGSGRDRDALPLRARARVLRARLHAGEEADYRLSELCLAYLVPSRGRIEVNGIPIHARDGAAIRNVAQLNVSALEETDVIMVDLF